MFNNFKLGLFPFVPALIGLITGCAMSEDPVSEGQEITSTESGNQPNGIRPEELLPDLAYMLAQRPLRYEELLPETLKRLEESTVEGARARTFLKYAFECAFSADEEFDFPWDSGDAVGRERFVGSNLAPMWRNAPLDVAGQQWVSACLAARTNLYGKHVNVLTRGSPSTLVASDEEIELFSSEEGVFWGNIFSSEPFLRSCYIGENVEHSRQQGRECAAGHLEDDGTTTGCGIITITGPCSKLCAPLSSGGFHPWCWLQFDKLPADAQTANVITVHLQ